MPPKTNKTKTCTPNDVVMTPPALAEAIVDHFAPHYKDWDTFLDPCCGDGAFYNAMEKYGVTTWCEISKGQDFFKRLIPATWIITNPPYSTFLPFLQHAMALAENVVFLIPPAKLYASLGVIRAVEKYGGIREIWVVGGGGVAGFPFGFPLAAVWIQRGFVGMCKERKNALDF